jgi:hypothetical protein
MRHLVTVPRVIGLALIILCALSYKTQGLARAGLLGIAGLILLFAQRQSAEKHWRQFAGSFKLTKDSALLMLFDALFWAALSVFILILAGVLQSPIEQLYGIKLGEGVTVGAVMQYNAMLDGIFAIAAASLAVFWLAVVAAYSLSRGLLWLTLARERFKPRFFARFALLNLGWCTAWLALALAALLNLQPMAGAVSFIVLLVLYTHLTTVLHASYARSQRAGESVREAFGTGLGGLLGFVQPFAYVFIVYVVLAQVQRLIPGTLNLIVTFLLFLAFMMWYRTYLSAVLRHTK